MKHQAAFKPLAKKISDAMEVGNRGSTQRSSLGVACVSLALWFGAGTLQAEEQLSDATNTVQHISASYFLESSQASSLFLGHTPETSGFKVREIFHLLNMGKDTLILQREIMRHDSDDDDRSVTLFRKLRPSRYAYQAWADVGTGFGQIFSAETFGRSRTNGVGVQDTDWFYLKMSFKF